MTSQTCSFASDTFHEATITSENYNSGDLISGLKIYASKFVTISIVVDQIETVLVVNGSQVGLSDSQTDTISKTLAKRTSGDLDTWY